MKGALLLLLTSLVQCSSLNNTICVRSLTGSVKTNSTWENVCTEVCSSINNCSFHSQSSTVIALDSGDHELLKSLQLNGKRQIKIHGHGSVSTRISCVHNAGLIFNNILYLSISDLMIVNCSTKHYSICLAQVSSAVFISGFRRVEISNITISHSSRNSMSLISECGHIVVKGSKFLYNNLGKLNVVKTGLYIEYNDCETTVRNSTNTQTLISDSIFIGNNMGNTIDTINNDITRGLFITFNGKSSQISLIITNSEFLSATGSGLSIYFLNSSYNNSVFLSSSYFANNTKSKSGNLMRSHQLLSDGGGGGVRILFDNYSSDNMVIIEDTNFVANTGNFGGGALILYMGSSHGNTVGVIFSNFSYNGVHGNPPEGGGGLSVLLMNSSYENKISINECHFIGNIAVQGAGMHLQLRDSTCCNNLSIENSVFTRNKSPGSDGMRKSHGGGIDAGFYFFDDHAPLNNSIYISQCYFYYNKAYFGGGTSIYSSYAFRKNINNNFHITNCSWRNNFANFGAAIDLSSKHLVYDYPPQGISPIPEFTNCTFIKNEVVNDMKKAGGSLQRSLGKGAFISTAMSARFLGTIIFDHCTGSAIHITSGYLLFGKKSIVTFNHNNGSIGGAISLVGRSSIIVQDHSRFSFIKNSALLNGGAISYFTTNRHSFGSFQNCFIEYIGEINDIHKRHIEFLFDGNSAPNGGNSIYATTIEHCLNTYFNCTNNPLNVFNCIANFTFLNGSDDLPCHQLATAGKNFKVKNNDSFPLSVVPGKKFQLPILMVDEFGNEVQARYQLALDNNINSFIPTAYSVLLKTNITKLYGNPGDSVEMTVFHKDGLQESELIFNVTFQSCPPGYVISKVNDQISCNTCICVCSKRYYVGIRCNYNTFTTQLRRGYWIGYDGKEVPTETNLVTGYCPEGYCSQRSKLYYSLPPVASRERLNQIVCAEGRTGILCGRCQSNYSASYHGAIIKCLHNEQCSYGPVLYILFELLPITVMFVIIIFFDVPFTSGAANGFLLFSQVIDTLQVQANRFIWFPAPTYALNTASIRFIYKVFTLQFFTANDIKGLEPLSFCLWKGSGALDMLAIHYVTLLYSLLLVVVTVKIINTFNIRKYCCKCCFKIRRKRTVRGSITHGLTTFILLCYSRYAQVSLMILIPGAIMDKNGKVIRQVVFYDGDVNFFSPTHMIYAIPALIICVMLILLPLILMVYPAYYKVFSVLGISESKCIGILCKVVSIEKLKPILDSFQGCFKDRFRFFAGLYFFYRLFAAITFAYTSNLTVFYMVVEVQLILMLTVHAFVQPYKKRWHNAIDAILLADLAIINTLTGFNFSSSFSRNNSRDLIISTTVQALLIWFPAVYMIVYILWYILIKMCGIGSKFKCKCQLQSIVFICRKYCEKNKTSDDCSAVELQSFYNTYED